MSFQLVINFFKTFYKPVNVQVQKSMNIYLNPFAGNTLLLITVDADETEVLLSLMAASV